MKKPLTAVQISDDQRETFKKMAKDRGISLSQLLRDGAEFYGSFDPHFWKIISGYSERHKLPPYLVIQNMLIKRFAQEAAEDEVWGPQPRDLLEFMHTEFGLLTGKALFKMLKEIYHNDFGQEKLRENDKVVKQNQKKDGK